MTTVQTGNLKIRLLAVAGVLLLTATLTWLLRETVRDVVVRPITYLLWLGSLFLRSVPEQILLAALILAGAYVALRSLTSRPPIAPASSAAVEPRRAEESRLRFWQSQFRYAPGSDFAAEKLAAELRSLLLNMLEHQERMSRDQVLQSAAAGELELPAPVRTLLLQQQRWKPSATLAVADLLPRLNSILRSLLRLPPVDEPPSPFEKELAVVIGWIEKRHGIGEKDLEEMSTNQGEKS